MNNCANCGNAVGAEEKCECGGCFCEAENCEHGESGHHKACHPQNSPSKTGK